MRTLIATLLVATAVAFVVSERVKLEKSPILGPRVTPVYSPVCECPNRHAAISFRLSRPDTLGVGMPGLVIFFHLAWTRRLDKLWDRRLLLGALVFVAVAAPWYAMVTLDSRGVWPRAFFGAMKDGYIAHNAQSLVDTVQVRVAPAAVSAARTVAA